MASKVYGSGELASLGSAGCGGDGRGCGVVVFGDDALLGVPGLTPQAFTLPATLSWNGFVIYHSETRLDAHGARYQRRYVL